MDRSNIYRATLEKWGEKAQYEQMVEECAELIAALKHFERGKVERSDIIAELADVTLMVGQLTWMFGEDGVLVGTWQFSDAVTGQCLNPVYGFAPSCALVAVEEEICADSSP